MRFRNLYSKWNSRWTIHTYFNSTVWHGSPASSNFSVACRLNLLQSALFAQLMTLLTSCLISLRLQLSLSSTTLCTRVWRTSRLSSWRIVSSANECSSSNTQRRKKQETMSCPLWRMRKVNTARLKSLLSQDKPSIKLCSCRTRSSESPTFLSFTTFCRFQLCWSRLWCHFSGGTTCCTICQNVSPAIDRI